MLKVVVPDSKTKLQKQIKALEYIISKDTNDKDGEIHKAALEQLKKYLVI